MRVEIRGSNDSANPIMSRRSKRVRFNPYPAEARVVQSSIISEDDESLWYSRNELKIFRAKNKAMIQMESARNNQDNSEQESDDTFDGLQTWEMERGRMATVRDARRSVFMEQQLQWDEEVKRDPQSIANVYHEISKHCALEAHKRALRHAQLLECVESVTVKLDEPTFCEQSEDGASGVRKSPSLLRRVSSLRNLGYHAYEEIRSPTDQCRKRPKSFLWMKRSKDEALSIPLRV